MTILKQVISSDGEEVSRGEVLEAVDNKTGNIEVETVDLRNIRWYNGYDFWRNAFGYKW